MSILAVDVGGSHAACALVSGTHILACKTVPARGTSNLEIVVSALTGAMRQLLASCPESDGCRGIGFSFCGVVDSKRCQILSSNDKYSDSAGFDLARWAQTEFNLPLRLENDARTALLGEWYAGAGRGSNDIVMLTLGTGIGGAAMIDGKLLRGKHFQAGCLGGHLGVNHKGRLCACGNIGCVEAEASSWSLPAISSALMCRRRWLANASRPIACRATPSWQSLRSGLGVHLQRVAHSRFDCNPRIRAT